MSYCHTSHKTVVHLCMYNIYEYDMQCKYPQYSKKATYCIVIIKTLQLNTFHSLYEKQKKRMFKTENVLWNICKRRK